MGVPQVPFLHLGVLNFSCQTRNHPIAWNSQRSPSTFSTPATQLLFVLTFNFQLSTFNFLPPHNC